MPDFTFKYLILWSRIHFRVLFLPFKYRDSVLWSHTPTFGFVRDQWILRISNETCRFYKNIGRFCMKLAISSVDP